MWFITSILLLFGLLVTAHGQFEQEKDDFLFGGEYCYLRCLAQCLQQHSKPMQTCQSSCIPYQNDTLCAQDNEVCWLHCDDLVQKISPRPATPANLRISIPGGVYDYYNASISWDAVADVPLYLLQRNDNRDVFSEWESFEPVQGNNFDFHRPRDQFCTKYTFRVAAVTANGISKLSPAAILPVPKPQVKATDRKVQVVSVEYTPVPFRGSNDSIVIKVNFTGPPNWPTDDQLEVRVVAHYFKCGQFTNPMANPSISQIIGTNEVEITTPGNALRKKCGIYLPHEKLRSSKCRTTADYNTGAEHQHVLLTCNTTINAPCQEKRKRIHPSCFIEKLEQKVIPQLATVYKQKKQKEENTTARYRKDQLVNVEISWKVDPITSSKKKIPILYYVVKWGEATPLETFDLGPPLDNYTNLPHPEHSVRTCAVANTAQKLTAQDLAQCNNNSRSLLLENIKVGQIYGVQICGVYQSDVEWKSSDHRITQARKILVKPTPKPPSKWNSGLMAKVIGIPLVVIFLILLLCALGVLLHWRRQKKQIEQMEFELSQRPAGEDRYTDFPKRHDIWELDRRNLITYSDQKLGSGAFGAVYKGRIIGKLLTHKDSSSSIATNIMRVENCDVAIKKLPEYADEISKSDFLKEINLMKSLGYHENLVNLLACITDSEPYCLIVELCSDGDLLHFLRDRCKYMMKLDELGISYADPDPQDNVDLSMILNLKKLISFGLQISYGLEYLSQKGFIHRDVAARNVLVHDLRVAKIGDFGLCRYIIGQDTAYWGKGGRLPIKWMAPEAIKNYEFTTMSDVWSFGVLLFEIITLGGSPYPGIQPADMEAYLDSGGRMSQPDNCPDPFYKVMNDCWTTVPDKRLSFGEARQRLASMLEEVTEEYSYLSLDQQRDYYNVPYSEDKENNNSNGGDDAELQRVSIAFRNNAFDETEELELERAEGSTNHGQTADLPSGPPPSHAPPDAPTPPPVPPRARRRDSGLDSISLDSKEELNAAPQTANSQSTDPRTATSDQFLITPAADRKLKFRFSTPHEGKEEDSGYSGSKSSDSFVNLGYADFEHKEKQLPV